ncbi:MAG: 4Fe-4S binding protein [Candidatus Heimdallarchaeota archaeon]|nr:MAG: 4Fe-4S binding protein [Candidatus Heimdallarchaeota archaeon]
MRCINIPRKIIINQNLCVKCLKCIRSCPAEIIIQENSHDKQGSLKITYPSLCFECRACEVICPVFAINVMCAIKNVSAP